MQKDGDDNFLSRVCEPRTCRYSIIFFVCGLNKISQGILSATQCLIYILGNLKEEKLHGLSP